jgi:acetyl esterase/lipase
VTTSVFHPDLRGIARWLPRGAVNPRTLKPIRMLAGLATRFGPGGVEVVPVESISVRLHRPPSTEEPAPALLWIHGGGYVIGSAAQEDAVCRHFVRELGIVVAAVDYRLAPEHPFPTPLHDCYDALSWLAARPEVDANRIAIGGASAGGGLAAALALLARDRGDIRPAFQLLTYPMLDDRTAVRTDVDETNFRVWNNKSNLFGWQSYTGHPPGSAEVSRLAAPARHDDLSGLPPAWIGVGSLDLFYEEDLAYAKRLAEAGVAHELTVIDGAFHGFDMMARNTGVTREFRAAQVKALSGALR